MKASNWKDAAELIGIAAIVGSLIFVGLELKQSQQATEFDSSSTRADWIIESRNTINDHPELWLKGNSGAQLSDTEQVIYSNLIRNFHTNNAFTWRRDQELGVQAANFAAEELAWYLHEHPAARREWERYMRELDERRETFGREPSRTGFTQAVRTLLEMLDEQD